MKTFVYSIKKLLATVLKLATFGLVDLNKRLRKSYRVELLKVKLNETKMKLKSSMDKLLDIMAELRVHQSRIEKLTRIQDTLKDKLHCATNDVSVFNDLAAQYKTNESLLTEENKVIEAYENAKTVLENNINLLNADIRKMKYEIEVIEAKQKTYQSLKEINSTMVDIHYPNGTDNSLNLKEVKEELDEDLTRESAKSELIRGDFEVAEPADYHNENEMNEFLRYIDQR